MWGSEFTTKPATPDGDSKELLPRSFLVGLNPVVPRAHDYRVTPIKRPRQESQATLPAILVPLRDASCRTKRIWLPNRAESLIFTEPTLLRAATRQAATSPPRCHRAWRFQWRHRVRKRSSHFAVGSLPLLGAYMVAYRNFSMVL